MRIDSNALFLKRFEGTCHRQQNPFSPQRWWGHRHIQPPERFE